MPKENLALTVPNIITASRVLMTLAAAVLFGVSHLEKVAAALCVSAALLDAFDGWFARAFSQCSELGKRLDPLADKIVIFVIYTIIAVKMNSVLIWILIGILFFREITITLLRDLVFRRRNILIPSSKLGKYKMIVQSVVGSAVLVYCYFITDQFSISTYVLIPALLVILILAYLSAYQYVISLRPYGVLTNLCLNTMKSIRGIADLLVERARINLRKRVARRSR